MKRHGPRIEGPTFCRFSSKLLKIEEGNPITLPFFFDNIEDLSCSLPLSNDLRNEIGKVSEVYPFRISKHYLSLINKKDPLSCPIGRQAIPTGEELRGSGEIDPLNEGKDLLTPTFIKRYPGRGVFLVNAECAMYCRFCNRRRMVGRGWNPRLFWEDTMQRLEKDSEIREVIISGGDPFMLLPDEFAYILSRLRKIGKTILRVSTRLPVVFPEGLTEPHYRAIEECAPLWVIIHINHPYEVSPEFLRVVKRLQKAGSVLVSQTVLLRNVNDCPSILGRLFEELVSHGIKPYYLFQLDEVKGACHFKVRIEKGLEIMKTLRRNISGLAVPHYALDISGGKGKVPVGYQYMRGREGDSVVVEGPSGDFGTYEDNGDESKCMKCGLCGRRRPPSQ